MRVQMTYVNVDETASEQPPVAATSSESETQWTRLLSEGSLALLVLIFIVSPARSDPFLIGPVIALYALREDDRRALLLYALLSILAIPLDLGFVFSATADIGAFTLLAAVGALVLKGALLMAAVKVHDTLPAARPARADPAKLQAKVQEVVEQVLREALGGQPASQAQPPQTPLAPPSQMPAPPPSAPATLGDTQWDQV